MDETSKNVRTYFTVRFFPNHRLHIFSTTGYFENKYNKIIKGI